MPFHVYIQSRIIRALRQTPPMDLTCASLQREFPVTRSIFLGGAAFRSSIQRKNAAHSVVLSAKKPEDVRERSITPMHGNFRGLQTRRSPRHVTENSDGSGRLQRNSTALGLGFQLQLPAARRDLLDIARNIREGERQLVISGLEINPAFIELDFFQVVHGSDRQEW